jgi:hypothetical protein
VEGINKIVTGSLVTLSEQGLVDCSKNGQNSGCNGGMMDDAFAFIAWNSGIDTDEDYPYTARDGKCDLAKKGRKVVSIDGFEDRPRNDEMSLQKAHYKKTANFRRLKQTFDGPVGRYFTSDGRGDSHRKLFNF